MNKPILVVCRALLFDSIINSIGNHLAHAQYIGQYGGIILVEFIKHNIYHGFVENTLRIFY